MIMGDARNVSTQSSDITDKSGTASRREGRLRTLYRTRLAWHRSRPRAPGAVKRSAADPGAAVRAETSPAGQLGAALRAVRDRRGQPLAAAHAELRAGRVRGLAGRTRSTGRGLLGRGSLGSGLGRGSLRRATLRLARLTGLPRLTRLSRLPRLARLAVRDAVLLRRLLRGLRLLRLHGLRLLGPERAGQAEPGAEERTLGAGAALGQALPRAERHLARGVVLEPAGQLGVAGVLGQLLELLLVLGGEVDVEVAQPGQLDAVGGELAVSGVDGVLLDLRRVRHQAQDRPSVADDLGGDVGPQHLEQLVADPAGDPLVVGDVDRSEEHT